MNRGRARVAVTLAFALIVSQGYAVPGTAAQPTPKSSLFVVGGTPNFARLVNESSLSSAFTALDAHDAGSVTIRITQLSGSQSSWTLKFVAPVGQPLGTGTYSGTQTPATASAPEISVIGGGYSCGGYVGQFAVRELVRDDGGAVTAFAADFSVRCFGFTPTADRVLAGEVRYNSTLAGHVWTSSASSLAFAPQLVSSTSAAQTVTITNEGNLPITPTLTVNGLSQPEFAATGRDGCLERQLPAGDECVVEVTYTPWRTGSSTAVLNVSSVEVAGLYPVALTGSARVATSTELIVPGPVAWPLRPQQQTLLKPGAAEGWVEIVNQRDGRLIVRRYTTSQTQWPFAITVPHGDIELVANYLGGTHAFPSQSDGVAFHVPIATATQLTASTRYARMGQPIDLYASMASPGTFRLTGGTLAIVDLESGATVATMNVTNDRPELRARIRLFAPRQWHRFEARYSGHGEFLPSSAGIDVSVRAITIASASASAESITAGGSVTIEGRVSAPVGAQPTTGSLTLKDPNGATVKTVPVTANSRSISAQVSPALGTHRYQVAYTGASGYEPSTESVVVTVAPVTDSVAPSGSVAIQGGATLTRTRNVTLALTASDPSPGTGVAEMQLSATGARGSWTPPEAYATSRAWSLSGLDGTKVIYARFIDGAGNVSGAASTTIVLDMTAPVGSKPDVSLLVGSAVGSSISVGVSFPATDALSAVKRYRLRRSKNGGSTWSLISLRNPSAPQATLALAPGATSYRLAAQSRDEAGNVSGWVTGDAFRLIKREEAHASIRYTGSWVAKSNSKASGGKFRVATRAASATVSFEGTDIGVVFMTGPDCGRVRLYLDDAAVPLATIDLYSRTRTWRRVTFSHSFAVRGPHTLEIRAVGTRNAASTGTRVPLDAVLVIE